jgi:hypothetical protein
MLTAPYRSTILYRWKSSHENGIIGTTCKEKAI